MTKTVKEILIETRQLIDKGWCKKSFATNTLGEKVSWDCQDAASFCLLGAVNRVCHNPSESFYCTDRIVVLELLKDKAKTGNLYHFNDNAKSKQEVLELLDTAILGK